MKHEELIKALTIEEKAALLGGKNEWQSRNIDRLSIPSIFMSDGPSGLRKQAGAGDHLGLNASVPATCFPSAATIANSWDEKLAERAGKALGAEAASEDVNVLLGPGMNIKRNPLCGRNFEYFSEDPYLAGKLAAAVIRGIQSNGCASCVKHFAVNSQESRRMAMNSVVDERTLREIYLTGFEIAVKEGHPKSIMSSYNQVNGVYANENAHLLKDILREEWGFDGAVITDWGGSNDHALGVKNGSTLEMPAPGLASARELLKALKTGKITEADIDARVDELLTLMDETRHLKKEKDPKALLEENYQIARDVAAQSMVLLKNEENILPIAKGKTVAVIGDFAYAPRYQGAGSSLVNSAVLSTMKDALSQDTYGWQLVGFSKGYDRSGAENEALKQEALELAKKADLVLLCFGLNEESESEGLDRRHIRIPENQVQLVKALADVNSNLVGILSAGSSIAMPWEGYFKALLHTGLYGEAGAEATLHVLSGRVNPSGKLSETYLLDYQDTPSEAYYPAKERNSEYREGLYVGYRYFETVKAPVRYPFGYGLSYTTFAYSGLQVYDKGVSLRVKNTGDCAGAEVVQLYVSLPNGEIFRPALELKGFAKVFLQPGEEQEVFLPFDDKTFRYYNTRTCHWEVEEGDYQIKIGASCQDIRLCETVHVDGTTDMFPYNKEKLPHYYSGEIKA
ncbi:MAG: glycoside hydrolase family 3 C-terminal domain-containing protein, partial [Lachnospiraceae bacterium]|nr:glycoside hydrolase family 3 C-terminal domain-containing protein [Lachnospiraceae bacterium]